jgi:hypothetical protein
MIQYIEVGNRVFRVETTPDEPGWRRRRFVATLESGPELTEDEAQQVTVDLVAELVSRGVDVIRWGYGEGGEDYA